MLQSHRIQAVQAPIIPIVAEWIRQTPGAISLGQGVVYYGPPAEAMERVAGFARGDGAGADGHKYKAVQGMAELLAPLERKLHEENAIDLLGQQVVVSAGGNMAFINALLAIADPGDEVVLLRPAYFNHEMAVTMATCRAVLVDTDDAYQPVVAAIRAALTARTRAVVTVSPNNPTGAVYSESTLRAINALCREKGIYHIHDEAYEYFTYDATPHFSPCSIAGSEAYTIGLFSLSKSYGMASWRVGYSVIPQHLFDAVRKIQDTILICPPVISQLAAIGALEAGRPYCLQQRRGIEAMRAQLVERLESLGDLCTFPRTAGAFYFLVRMRTGLSGMEFAHRLVREYGVAVIPGEAFAMRDGCYVRVAYGALLPEMAAQGFLRLATGIAAICGGRG